MLSQRDKAELGIVNNYLINGGAESSTASLSAFTTTFTAGLPTTITPGAANLSITRVTTNILMGYASFQMNVTTAAGSAGQGIITDAMTLKDSDLGKLLAVYFDYNFIAGQANVDVSGTSTQTIEVWVYNVGLNSWYQPAGFRSINTKGTSTQFVPGTTPAITFQSEITNTSNTNQYRIAWIIRNAPTGTFQMNFDSVTFGRQYKAYGPPITDWQAYNLTIGAVTTPPTLGTNTQLAEWRRVGDSVEIRYYLAQTSAGTAGTGIYLFSLPPGLAIDTTKMPLNTNPNGAGGSIVPSVATASNTLAANSANVNTGFMVPYTSTSLAMIVNTAVIQQLNAVSSTAFLLSATNIYYSFTARVPIQGWSSSVQMSNDTDSRVVAFRAFKTTVQSISAETKIIDWTTVFDTTGSFDAVNNRWVAPVSGYYQLIEQVNIVGTPVFCCAYKVNGGQTIYIGGVGQIVGSAGNRAGGSAIVKMNAGDYLEYWLFASGATIQTSTGDTNTFWCIDRLSGPSVIAANDTVAMRYSNSAGTAISTSRPTVAFAIRAFDTFNMYNTSTGIATIPTSGKYRLSGRFMTTSVTLSTTQDVELQVKKNGVTFVELGRTVGAGSAFTYATGGTDTVQLLAGDTIEFNCWSSVSTTLITDGTYNYISIERIGN